MLFLVDALCQGNPSPSMLPFDFVYLFEVIPKMVDHVNRLLHQPFYVITTKSLKLINQLEITPMTCLGVVHRGSPINVSLDEKSYN